jgi:sensor histidine kinase regulating citrate/malate metabolism
MKLILFIPHAVVLAYTICQLKRQFPGFWWILSILLTAASSGVYFISVIYLPYCSPICACMCALAILSFALLHIKARASAFFYGLYLATILALMAMALYDVHITYAISIIIMLIFLLSESSHRYIRKSYEQAASEYQNKVLSKQIEEVQNIYMTMRGWRHDYHNHLQSLKAQLSMGKVQQAQEYLGELEEDLDNVNQLVETGNVNLDAIINSKISLALKYNINVNYKASVPSSLTASDIDLCVLIGNLIDNAVESCEKLPERDRFLRLYVGVLKKQLYISVTNSTSETVRKLDEEYISTKRGNHGHGLKRINRIVSKYEGYINRKNEPGVFVTEVMLPL